MRMQWSIPFIQLRDSTDLRVAVGVVEVDQEKRSSIPRWRVCVEKGCCAVCVMAGCLWSRSGGYDHRGVNVRGIVGHSRKDFING